jgi:hypothetical protein
MARLYFNDPHLVAVALNSAVDPDQTLDSAADIPPALGKARSMQYPWQVPTRWPS